MEDWVERLHQTGKHQCLRYCTVQNPVVCSLAREKANSHNMHPDVIAQISPVATEKLAVRTMELMVPALSKY
jgi:hypothetical protein